MAIKTAYGAAEQEICELFADYLEGDGGRPALCIGENPPSAAVRNAVSKSLEAFGYDVDSCTFASLKPISKEAAPHSPQLDAQALYLLVEGLDPLYVIAIDAIAIGMLAKAYRTSYALDAPIRVFGRSSVAFKELDSLLETPSGKQKAWKILKSLQA